MVIRNAMSGSSRGLEAAANLDVGAATRLVLHYGYLDLDLEDPAGTSSRLDAGGSPTHQARLGVAHDLSARLSVDAALRYVDGLPALDVDDYAELDLRLARRPAPGLEVHATLRNALAGRHQEHAPVSLHSDPALLERSLRLGLTWQP